MSTASSASNNLTPSPPSRHSCWDTLLNPIRHSIDRLQIQSPRIAHIVCRLIPCTCPFEHHFTLFGNSFHTPPLCELNPFYNEFVSLRFRALSYLAEVCGEDVSRYC
ncbi:Mo-dependent nitrogenase C-terminal domain-containing protein [Leptolyngbya ohadii]|uniref:Mo-dependent nitrogenase C-terminal domain-containing protein n=1 Tax=Leptolyngbya ohadii TaxID=1962290 RepID=UPI000B5A1D72|nr:Mo-dependent nitrogenase C-terminal domain-containing protein [Leptolyngbya ohadii]